MRINYTPIKHPLNISSSWNIKKCLNSNFNNAMQINIPFDELISISTSKKITQENTHSNLSHELYNKVNHYKQILHFKESQFEDYANEVKSFEKYFFSYFQKVSMFDIETFIKLKGDFEKIQMTFDNNIRNNADKFEWEIFQSSTNNFLDYLKSSLNKIKEIDMKKITEDIMCKVYNVDLEKEMMIKKKMTMIKGDININDGYCKGICNRKGVNNHIGLLNEMSSAFLQRKTRFIDGETEDNNNDEDIDKEEICNNTNKLFMKSFRQIYLIKENGKVSHSEFDKDNINDVNLRSSKINNNSNNIKKRKTNSKTEWIRISMYISKEEDDEDVYEIIDTFTNHLFKKYIIMFKPLSNDLNIKVLVYGSCRKSEQNVIDQMKTLLNKNTLKYDTVIKIDSYYYSKHTCLNDCITKIKKNKEYNVTSNILSNI